MQWERILGQTYGLQKMRVPVHAGHHSGMMPDRIPGTCRTAFRCDAGHFGGLSGMLSGIPGMTR